MVHAVIRSREEDALLLQVRVSLQKIDNKLEQPEMGAETYVQQNCLKGPSRIGAGMTQDDDLKNEELYSIPQQLVAELFACISGRGR